MTENAPQPERSADRAKRLYQSARAEAVLVAAETLGRSRQAKALAEGALTRRRLVAEMDASRTALGQAMVGGGTGDDHLRRQAADVADRIESLQAARGSTKPLDAELLGLRLRLADGLAADAPDLPATVMASADRVQTARRVLDAHDEQMGRIAVDLKGADRSAVRRVAVGVGVPVVALGLVGWLLFRGGRAEPAPAVGPPPGLVVGLDDEGAIKRAVGLVACGARVISPEGVRTELVTSTGSCFAVTPDGFLMTNKHVVEDTWNLMHADLKLADLRKKQVDVKPSVWVFFGADKHVAEIRHVSDRYDLAVLKVDRPAGPWLKLRTGATARGKPVYSIGFPGAGSVPLSKEEEVLSAARSKSARTVEGQFKKRDLEFTLTNGTVSRTAAEENDVQWLQHTASINPGNSGGPLIAADRAVVGINTLLINKAQGVFYALPFAQIRDELDKHIPGLWRE